MIASDQALQKLKMEMEREQRALRSNEIELGRKEQLLGERKRAFENLQTEVTRIKKDGEQIRARMSQHESELSEMQRALEKLLKK